MPCVPPLTDFVWHFFNSLLLSFGQNYIQPKLFIFKIRFILERFRFRPVRAQPLSVMDRPERFSLEWSEFENNLQNTFAELRREENFSDVTLVSEDGHLLKAHKVLLSANSPLLDTILKSQDHPRPLIFMRGAKVDALNSLLDFIYHGKVEVTGDHLDEFMALANELKVKGLSKEDEKESTVKNDPKVAVGKKKIQITYKKGPKEDIFVKEEGKLSKIEEDKSEKEMNDDFIDVSNPVVREDEKKIDLLDCDLCEKTSTTMQGLDRHKYRYHSAKKEKLPSEEVPVVPCNLCEATSKSKAGLQKHMLRHHSNSDLPSVVLDENCPVAEENPKILFEEEGLAFSCDLCDATSKSKAGLYKHKIRNH